MGTGTNHLVDRLPCRGRQRLLALSEPATLELGSVLCEPGERLSHVYFPSDSFISLVTAVGDGPALEVGMVGREGMLGAHLALGIGSSPLHAVVQGPGTASRIAAGPFCREIAQSTALRRDIHRYLYVLMGQLATAAACTRFHSIGPRLARWLLMSQDRAGDDSFYLTQEFLAYMLGVRRVGISGAASALQRQGLIRYHRGKVTVLNRAGLEAAACSCYAIDRASYDRLLG